MVRPTLTQRFFASIWLWQIAFWGFPVVAGVAFVLHFQREFGVPLAVFGGAACGVVVSHAVLRMFWRYRARVNGSPFSTGDHVRILVGPHAENVVTVYEVWEERGQVRVSLGEQAKRELKDVFGYLQVCTEKPAAARNTIHEP